MNNIVIVLEIMSAEMWEKILKETIRVLIGGLIGRHKTVN